ncbi:MAG: helix-turn-helix transcriptional regulator [Ruminococcaceae bacterium]|nr:helix-turn-helix transcriptional regulator [Oscillospiraceae bacterium]
MRQSTLIHCREPEVLLEERLKKLRKSRCFTQQRISELLGIDRSSYSYYETGKTRPSIKMLIKLSCIYQVSIDYLVGNRQDENDRND